MLCQFSNAILFPLKCAHLLFQNYSEILKFYALLIASRLQIQCVATLLVHVTLLQEKYVAAIKI